MGELRCPRCQAEQVKGPIEELEGRDWHCPGCNAYLICLRGRLSILQPPPPLNPGS